MATPNPFDQFDEVAPSAVGANPFDQFDVPDQIAVPAVPAVTPDTIRPASNRVSAPPPAITRSFSPLNEQTRQRIKAEYDAGTPEDRARLMAVTGAVGQYATELDQRYALMDDIPVGPGGRATDAVDARAEARARRLGMTGLEFNTAEKIARESAQRGIDPGLETSGGSLAETDFDFERAKQWRESPLLSNPIARGVVKGATGFARGAAGVGEAISTATGIGTPSDFSQRLRGYEQEVGQSADPLGRNLEGAISSITQQIPGLATGSTPLSLGSMAFTSFGQEYSDGIASQLDPENAALRASLFAGFEMVGESFGLGPLLDKIKLAGRGIGDPAELVKFFSSQLKKEIPGEQLTYAGQFLTDKLPEIGLNPDATLEDYIQGAGNTVLQTVMQGGLMAGGTTGIASGVRALTDARATADAQAARNESLSQWSSFGDALASASQKSGGVPAALERAKVQAQAQAEAEAQAEAQAQAEEAAALQYDAQRSAAIDALGAQARDERIAQEAQAQAQAEQAAADAPGIAARNEELIAKITDPNLLDLIRQGELEAEQRVTTQPRQEAMERAVDRRAARREEGEARRQVSLEVEAAIERLIEQQIKAPKTAAPVRPKSAAPPTARKSKSTEVKSPVAPPVVVPASTPVPAPSLPVPAADAPVSTMGAGTTRGEAIPQTEPVPSPPVAKTERAPRQKRSATPAAPASQTPVSEGENGKNREFDFEDTGGARTAEPTAAPAPADVRPEKRAKRPKAAPSPASQTPVSERDTPAGTPAAVETASATADKSIRDSRIANKPSTTPAQTQPQPTETAQEDRADETDEDMVDLDDDIGTTAAQELGETEDFEDSEPGSDEETDNRLDNALAGKTGKPPQAGAGGTQQQPTKDPLIAIAGRKAQRIREEAARKAATTPGVSPTREGRIGVSTYDTMWRDLFGASGTTATEEKQRMVTRIQTAPTKTQLRLARQRMKHYFGFKDIQIEGVTDREALDALLDAYNNLHTMASVMLLPRQSMGFNGQLTLRLVKTFGSAGKLGEYAWTFGKFDKSRISLARRADTFMHEWIHALDLNLLMSFSKARVKGASALSPFTTEPIHDLPPEIRAPFTRVLRSLLVNNDDAATQLADLSVRGQIANAQIAKEKEKARVKDPEKRARHENEAKRLQKLLDETNKQMVDILNKNATNFSKGSRYVDQLTGNNYFSLPTEMLARAGEAWMANRIGAQGGTEFLTANADFYNENSDPWMAMVYPSATDREGIFQAFDGLFQALSQQEYFQGNTVMARMPGTTIFEKELNDAAKRNEAVSAIRETYEAAKRDFVNLATAPFTARPTGDQLAGAWERTKAAFHKSSGVRTFRSAEGMVSGLIRAAKGKPELQRLLRKFLYKIGTDPGVPDDQRATAQERIDRRINIDHKVIDRIAKEHGLDSENAEQMQQLHDALARPTEQERDDLLLHQQFLEDRLARAKGDANKIIEAATIQNNLQTNAAALKKLPLPEKPTDNIERAALKLRQLSDRWYYDAQEAGIKHGYVSNHVRRVINRNALNDEVKRSKFVEQATLAYEATNDLNIRKLQRQIGALQDEKRKFRHVEKPPPAVKRIDKQIAAKQAEIAEIRALDPQMQAESYLASLTLPDLFQPEAGKTPAQNFAKHRVLSPMADLLLQDFYDQNPLQNMYAQASSVAHRTVYAEMFGAESEKLKADRLDLVRAGLDPQHLDIIDTAVRTAFGQIGSFHSPMDTLANWAMLVAQMKMLSKSVITNLAEPFNTAKVTGRTRDGWMTLARTYLPVLERGQAKEQQFVMEELGLIMSDAAESVFVNRSASGADENMLRKFQVGFGKISKLKWVTDRSRFAAFRTLSNYAYFLSNQINDKNPKIAREARNALRMAGVPAAKIDEFSSFMLSMPKGEISGQMFARSDDAEMKSLYGDVMYRLMRQSIQMPQRTERAQGSFHPVGRFVFSITNFTRSFERNVILRSFKEFKHAEGWDRKAVAAGRTANYMMQITMLVMLANMAREFWDDWEKAGEKDLADYLTPLAIFNAWDRAGFTGRFSAFFNIFTKSKFDREATALAAGAVPSFYLDSLVKMVYGMRPGASAAQERQGWGAFYDLTVGLATIPALVAAKVTGPLGWVLASKLNSRGWKTAFAERMAGEPDKKSLPNPTKEIDKEMRQVMKPINADIREAMKE